MSAEMAEDDGRTPVDDLLQFHRPVLDRSAATAEGPVARARRSARRVATAWGGPWYAEQRAFENRVREAIAYLDGQVRGERRARELAEQRLREVGQRQGETARELAAGIADLAMRVRHLEAQLRGQALDRARAARPAGGEQNRTIDVPSLEDFDYLAFEDRFRGTEELIQARQAVHADRFLEVGGPVVDLGCGRGEMLELLRERGIEAVGVDAAAEMVALCESKGLHAEHDDLFAWLAARPFRSLGGILCSHVVEHLWPADHLRFARLCAAALRPGGLLIVETPNPKSLIAGAVNFSCDPTHLRPVFPETLQFMLEAAGFENVEIEYLSPVPASDRATPVTDVPEGLERAFEQLNESIARLDALVFGDRDYAVVGRAGDLARGV